MKKTKLNNNVSTSEVSKIVYSYKEPAVTDELYSFGNMLLTEIRSRAGHIDSKATTMLGWSTGILVFLFTQIDKHSGLVTLAFAVASGAASLAAAIYAFLAVRAREEWIWPSDRDWFQDKALSSSDELKRFHIRSIHEVKQAQNEVTDKKGERLLLSQDCLICSAIFLALGILLKMFL